MEIANYLKKIKNKLDIIDNKVTTIQKDIEK